MPNRERANILIVDNQAENLLVMENLLKGPDRHVVLARSDNEALAFMFDHEFALVVVSIGTAEPNGCEVARVLRRSQKTRNIPIIFITEAGQEQPWDADDSESGTVDYLVRPFEPRILKSKVKVFLELSRQQESLKKTTEALQQTVTELEQANRRILEQQQGVIEEERFGVLLQMAGATAHAINQPLTTLLGHIELLKINRDKPDQAEQRIDTIQRAGKRISDIVNKMQPSHSARIEACPQGKPMIDCSRELKILSVEPSVADFQRLETLLELHPQLQLRRAAGIHEAFAHLAAEPVDVVLVEHRLQDGNAFDFLKAADERGLTQPVVVVTGTGDELLAAEVIQAGAYDYISKNWLSDTCLLRSVYNAFEKCRLKREMQDLVRRMAEMSTKDELTGLYNRRFFTEALEREMARAKRYGNELALCMIDLDHFKTINDTYGHPAGDAALAHIGAILAESIRQSDLACRYGGDEFAIILPNTSIEEATRVCERIRQLVAGYQFPNGSQSFRLTTSIGVANYDPRCHETAVDLVSSSDQALYESKNEGRNGVTWGNFQPRGGIGMPLFNGTNGSLRSGSMHDYCQSVVEVG